MFRTIKSKLLLSFAVFFCITTVWVGTVLWTDSKKNSIEDVKNLLLNNRILFSDAVRLEKDFLLFETINPDFFKCDESRFLTFRAEKILHFRKNLTQLKSSAREHDIPEIEPKIDSLQTLIEQYERNFDSLVHLTLQRGFKNFGFEGEMRDAIHIIENAKTQTVEKSTLLTLRRFEKDYLLRKDMHYVEGVLKIVNQINRNLLLMPKDSAREETLKQFTRYRIFFEKIVETETKIGFFETNGLRGEMLKTNQLLEQKNEQINNTVLLFAKNFDKNIKNLLIFISIGSIFLIAGLSLYSVKKLSSPVERLSRSINQAVDTNFADGNPDILIAGNDEIARLSHDFDLMYNKVRISLEYIRNQTTELQNSQDLIMDSLRYARTIQAALLPDTEQLKTYFSDAFVIFTPKNVVSGDFFWLYRKKQKIFLAVADCTGHGVPGAFMTLIGNMLLTKIIEPARIYDPALILETLHLELRSVLQQHESKNDDGMDIALCSFENTTEGIKLTFAGAKRNLMLFSGEIYEKIRGNKRSIGGKQKTFAPDFENKEVILKKNDLIYLYSDGFYDQHNEKREKYGSERFEFFIKKIYELPLEEQKKALEEEFEKFKKNQKQRDDVTLLAVKI
jgi:serine phosphatase RsbU (regulator of sigma subunit)